MNLRRYFSFENILIVCSSFGLLSSVILTIEKFHLLENPQATLSCDLNPIIACGSVINTDQASAFGFPNPIIGIISFSVVLTIGMALKSGATFKPWFWKGLQAGAVFGIGFVHWLMYQSIFTIKALCPYCMVVWAVMIPLFVYITRYNIAHKNIGNFLPKKSFLRAFEVVILWYVLVAAVILFKFWYYWQTVLPFVG